MEEIRPALEATAANSGAEVSTRSLSLRMRSSSGSEKDFDTGSRNLVSGRHRSIDNRYSGTGISQKDDATMFDVFFRRSKKDSSMRIIADAVKEVVNVGSNVASGVAAVTGISSSSGAAARGSTTSMERRDSDKSRNSSTMESAAMEIQSQQQNTDAGSAFTGGGEGGDEVETERPTEYVPVHLKNKQQHFEGVNDGASVFVKSTRLSQTLSHHMGGIYAMKFSPDGKFLATAGEDTSLVIWTVGQKQYQPEQEEDGDYHSDGRPVSGNYTDSDYHADSRPESGSFTVGSFGYGGYAVSNSNSDSRPSSGNFSAVGSSSGSSSGDGANSDESRGHSNGNRSSSPHTVENDGTMTPKSMGSSMSGSGDSDEDDGDSEHRASSVNSDLSGDASEMYGSSGRRRSNSPFSKGGSQFEYTMPVVPRGTRRGKVVDRDVIIYPIPARVYSKGHNEPIVDISWSKSNFLLTASSDKTVCLWHVSQSERLQCFAHNGIVTSVDFHPVHDRYFISGCFDGKIRFWDVIANSTLDFILTRSGGEEDAGKVTCVKFTPDGGKIVAGFFGGKVAVYYCIARGDMKYELKYQTEFFCKDRAGRYLNGRKVTGLSFIEGTKATFEAGIPLASARKDAGKGSVVLENYLLLVTTNDSNVRLVDWAEKTTFVKYKGGLNESLQTQASLSDCDRFIISGTDDGSTVIWETQHFDNPLCIHAFEPPRPHKRNATMAKFQSSLKDKKTGLAPPVTSASFAPISAVHNVLESAEELYRLAIGSRDRDGPRSRIDSFGSDTERGSLPSLGGESTPGGDSGKNHHHHDFVPVDAPSDVPLYRAGDEDAFGSLIMATADLDGNLRIYVRESSEV